MCGCWWTPLWVIDLSVNDTNRVVDWAGIFGVHVVDGVEASSSLDHASEGDFLPIKTRHGLGCDEKLRAVRVWLSFVCHRNDSFSVVFHRKRFIRKEPTSGDITCMAVLTTPIHQVASLEEAVFNHSVHNRVAVRVC